MLLRLVELWPEQACEGLRRRRELPPPVRDVMLRHPSPTIRGALASHPQVDPLARAHLLADPAWRVRHRAFGRPGQAPLPDDVLVRLLTELDDPPSDVPFSREELIDELFGAMGYDRRLFRLAAAHPRPGVRRFAAGSAIWLDERSRRALLEDEVPEVRAAAVASDARRHQVMEPADLPDQHCHGFWSVLQRPLSPALVDQVLASGDAAALRVMAENPSVPPDVVEMLLRHPDPSVRQGVAGRVDLSGDQLVRLSTDPAVEVRTAVSTHPGLSEPQRASIDIDVTTVPDDGHFGSADVRCREIPIPTAPRRNSAMCCAGHARSTRCYAAERPVTPSCRGNSSPSSPRIPTWAYGSCSTSTTRAAAALLPRVPLLRPGPVERAPAVSHQRVGPFLRRPPTQRYDGSSPSIRTPTRKSSID
ncbi:hypothetical protein [Micromonospora sp. NPDC005203]|uniref:hypothetical protein n=1 Tax=Micromonospora sp. NPDC005203 TaxID=3364226 RepID=UPI00369B57F7